MKIGKPAPGAPVGRESEGRKTHLAEAAEISRLIAERFVPPGEVRYLPSAGPDGAPCVAVALSTGSAGIRLVDGTPEDRWREAWLQHGLWHDGYGTVYAAAVIGSGKAAECAAELLGKAKARQWEISRADVGAMLAACPAGLAPWAVSSRLRAAIRVLESVLPGARDEAAAMKAALGILDLRV